MGERRANIPPRYAVRLSDLRSYHVLTAVCWACRHRRQMRLWQLKTGQHERTFLQNVEKRLRCMRCGTRGQAQVLVTVTEVDD